MEIERKDTIFALRASCTALMDRDNVFILSTFATYSKTSPYILCLRQQQHICLDMEPLVESRHSHNI